MEPSKREVDEALRPIEADPELAKLMESAARAAHTSRQMTWQADGDECLNRWEAELKERFNRQHADNEHCEHCQWIKSVKSIGAQLGTADNAYRQAHHRAETLKVTVQNWKLVAAILLLTMVYLVGRVRGWW